MKRANKFKLALLGAGVLGLTFYVFGEEAEEEALTYPSVEACVKAGVTDEATCKAEFTKAQNLHNQVAPRYATSGNCYSDYGYNRCYQNRMSGGSVWLPFMMGYVFTQPLSRPSGDPNRFYTSGGGRVGAATADGRTKVAKSQTRQPRARTRTVARGGFGRRATSAGS
jgi:uncharacterized protein YgiB involved in biofilm formation